MIKCLAALAVTFAAVALVSCTGNAGTTLSVSLTGQPSPIDVTTGADNILGPSIFYRGTAQALLLTINVIEAPAGGSVNINPRTSILTVSSGVVSTPPQITVSFNAPGTYILEAVVQESGDGASNNVAKDDATFVAIGAATN